MNSSYQPPRTVAREDEMLEDTLTLKRSLEPYFLEKLELPAYSPNP